LNHYSVNYFIFVCIYWHVGKVFQLLFTTVTSDLCLCYRLRDVVLNIAASVIFTCALGLFFIHASVLWKHYQVTAYISIDEHKNFNLLMLNFFGIILFGDILCGWW